MVPLTHSVSFEEVCCCLKEAISLSINFDQDRIMNRLKEAIDHGYTDEYAQLRQEGVNLSDSLLMKYLFENYRSITNMSQTTIRKKFINEVTLYEAHVGVTYAEHQEDSVLSVDISLTTILNGDFKIKSIVLRR